MKLIVGLGNPGREYADTRHNVGFRIVDELATRWSAQGWRKSFEGLAAEANAAGQRVLLLKPQTFMNLSGRSVAAAVGFYRCLPDDLLAVSDDLDLPLGTLRLRVSGSAGGQRGLADVIQRLGYDTFARLRFGIGRSAHGSATQHVLGRFAEDEKELAAKTILTAADAATCWLQEGPNAAMNKFNRTTA